MNDDKHCLQIVNFTDISYHTRQMLHHCRVNLREQHNVEFTVFYSDTYTVHVALVTGFVNVLR